jgi:L-rhamnose mutarotase
MAKIAFKMKLNPGVVAEYKKRHDEIWPELVQLLRGNGVSDYTIFFDEGTNLLFAVQQNAAGASSQDLASTAIVQKWWAYMADLMETNPDHSPVTIELKNVFHMD